MDLFYCYFRYHKNRNLWANATNEHTCKNPEQHTSKQNPIRIINHDQLRLIPGIQGFFNICKLINVIHHTKKLKNKNHMITSIDTEKASDQIQHPFMIKTPKKVGIEGVYFNIINAIYDRPKANIILKSEKLKAFPPRSGTKQGCPLSPRSFNIVITTEKK